MKTIRLLAAIAVLATLGSVSPAKADGASDSESLSAIARELAIVRELVERTCPEKQRVFFDCPYAIEVLAYLEASTRAHQSLQASQPRPEWDLNRRERLARPIKGSMP